LERAAAELEIAPAPAASPMIRGTGIRGGMRIIYHLVTAAAPTCFSVPAPTAIKGTRPNAETRETCKLIATIETQG
jgi:hypothetical protein